MKVSKLRLMIIVLCVLGIISLVFFNKQLIYWNIAKYENTPKAYLDYAYWAFENKRDTKSEDVITRLQPKKQEAINEMVLDWKWNKWIVNDEKDIKNAIMEYISRLYTADVKLDDMELEFSSKGFVNVDQLLKGFRSKIIIKNKEYGPFLNPDRKGFPYDFMSRIGGWEITINLKSGNVEVKYGIKNVIKFIK